MLALAGVDISQDVAVVAAEHPDVQVLDKRFVLFRRKLFAGLALDHVRNAHADAEPDILLFRHHRLLPATRQQQEAQTPYEGFSSHQSLIPMDTDGV